MNGAHDMGGMQGFGPVVREDNEPVFHAPWEGRVIALRRALGAIGVLPPTIRPAIESIPPADYLRNSYYENWLTAIETLVASGGDKSALPLTPEEAAFFSFRVPQVMLTTEAKPRYAIGQTVRARNIHPVGHTRLPRYARGRTGLIEAFRGVQAFPDTDGEIPQHVYAVRFTARELWGDAASERDSVYIDLWEDYLEPV